MKKTQFGEKVMEAGYHINEMSDHATVWKEGNYICNIMYADGRYQLPYHHKYTVPNEIKALIEKYGKN